jgi:hypothetical protein
MENQICKFLNNLVGNEVQLITSPENDAAIEIKFSNDYIIECAYWRCLKPGECSWSRFDHGESYGLATTVDAVQKVRDRVVGIKIVSARVLALSGDIEIGFDNRNVLQVLNFTGYEWWTFKIDDLTEFYSNYEQGKI